MRQENDLTGYLYSPYKQYQKATLNRDLPNHHRLLMYRFYRTKHRRNTNTLTLPVSSRWKQHAKLQTKHRQNKSRYTFWVVSERSSSGAARNCFRWFCSLRPNSRTTICFTRWRLCRYSCGRAASIGGSRLCCQCVCINSKSFGHGLY